MPVIDVQLMGKWIRAGAQVTLNPLPSTFQANVSSPGTSLAHKIFCPSFWSCALCIPGKKESCLHGQRMQNEDRLSYLVSPGFFGKKTLALGSVGVKTLSSSPPTQSPGKCYKDTWYEHCILICLIRDWD